MEQAQERMNSSQAFTNDVFKAMSLSYDSIFLVDLENGKMETYRKNENLPLSFWNYVDTNPSYDELLKYYIDARVIEGGKQQMWEQLRLDSLRKKFKKQPSYSYDFRVNTNDISSRWYRMKLVNFSRTENLTLFAVGFENISEQKRTEEMLFPTGKKILIVDDSRLEREILTHILENDYPVITAEDGEKGLDALEKYYKDIALILLDIEMPVCDGYEFLSSIQGVRRYNTIPVIVTTASESACAEIKALELGASDFIAKPYNHEIVLRRVKSLIRLRSSMTMLNTLERDSLTGLYTKDFFFQYAHELIVLHPEVEYRIVLLDIENFRLINEKYGIDTGNQVLRHIARAVFEYLPGTLLAGRMNGDQFVLLQKDVALPNDKRSPIFQKILQDAPVTNLILKCGVYLVRDDRDLSIQVMCDRARLAMESIRNAYGQDYAVYDDKLREKLLMEQQIVESMDEALSQKQFQVYMQPKQNLHENKTGGAEALVRWIHPELGFMNPGVFIPLFEQNGFIKELDHYVFVQVCETLSRWKQEGKTLIPISVNLSRRDFEQENLARKLIECTDYFGVDHSLIHIELTESAFSDNPDLISKTIKTLHDSGFVIELDDFGTGYSSLTTLNSIDIDYLKLDMSIIQNDVPGSERNVLDFCMQLVKMMKLKSVAEGAETVEHIERLKDIGCDYVQGYYYSKPLPIDQLENYLEKATDKQ